MIKWGKGGGGSFEPSRNQGRNYATYNNDENYVLDGNFNYKNKFKRNGYGNMNEWSGPNFHQ